MKTVEVNVYSFDELPAAAKSDVVATISQDHNEIVHQDIIDDATEIAHSTNTKFDGKFLVFDDTDAMYDVMDIIKGVARIENPELRHDVTEYIYNLINLGHTEPDVFLMGIQCAIQKFWSKNCATYKMVRSFCIENDLLFFKDGTRYN